MKSSRLWIHLATFCALVLALGGSAACNMGARSEADKSKVHVGIVFDIGGKDDRSFNASAWEGVKRAAKDFPIVLRDVEPGDPTSVEPAIRAFAERKETKLANVAQPLRAALTGRTTSPPIFDVLAVLGKEESLARLRDQI